MDDPYCLHDDKEKNSVKQRSGGIVVGIKIELQNRLFIYDIRSENDTISITDRWTRTMYTTVYVPPSEIRNRSMIAVNTAMRHINEFSRRDWKVVTFGDWNARFVSQDIRPQDKTNYGSWKRGNYMKEVMSLYNLAIVTPYGRKKYTYLKKNKEKFIKTNVDHVMVMKNICWDGLISVSIRSELRHTSDHCPLIIRTSLTREKRPKPMNKFSYYIKEDLKNIAVAEKEVLKILKSI
jgi:exonuclease III